METKINKWLRENKTLSVLLMMILFSGLVIAGDVIPSLSDNVKDFFETKNISTRDIDGDNLDEVYKQGTPKTMVFDSGCFSGIGEKACSVIIFDESEIKPLKEDLYEIYKCNNYKYYFNETSNKTEQTFVSKTERACENIILNETSGLEICAFKGKFNPCEVWETINIIDEGQK